MLKLLAAALFLLGLAATQAPAQSPKIFLASTGSDANDGSRALPKRSLQAAHDAVAANGNIVILDTAGYGRVTITKSLAVTVPPGVNGFVTASAGLDGIMIDAGPSGDVSLQGLIVEGNGSRSGILVASARTVTLEDVLIRTFATGVAFELAKTMKINVNRLTIRDVDTGVVFDPVENSRLDAKLVDVVVSNARFDAFTVAAFVGRVNAAAYVLLSRCEVSGSGVAVDVGASGFATLDDCKIAGNNFAFYKTLDAGTIFTYGNNKVAYNTTFINGANVLTTLPPR